MIWRMIHIKRINYRQLKKDLLDYVGPSGIWPLILSVDGADEEELLELAEQLRFDVSKYIIYEDEENEFEFEEIDDEDDIDW